MHSLNTLYFMSDFVSHFVSHFVSEPISKRNFIKKKHSQIASKPLNGLMAA